MNEQDEPKTTVTLHARSSAEARGSLKTPLTNSIASDPATANVAPQVRYKKSRAHSRFCQPGNTFDMAGQLG